MNFLLSDEQEQLFDTVLRFASEQSNPGGAARRAYNGDGALDKPFWQGMMDLGLGGLVLPEDQGGFGLEMIDLALAAEALGRAAAPGPLLGHALAGIAINLAGSAEQKAQWLPRLISGEMVATIVLEAPEPADWAFEPVDHRLHGTASNVLCGHQADVLVVGLAGGVFAIVPVAENNVSATMLDGADKTRPLADVVFDGAGADVMPGTDAAARVVDAGLVLLAADAFGGASHCVEIAVDYAKTREQFGQLIGQFQGLKFQLTDMAVDVEPARGLYWYAAHAYDHVPDEARLMAATAKAHCADVYRRASRSTIEAHGGIGYTWEHEAQIYFKRALFDFSFLGTPVEHRDRQAHLNGW